MKKPAAAALWIVGLALAGACEMSAAGAPGPAAARAPDVLEQILRSRPEWFADVLAKAEEHRLQILYTQIDRDSANRPSFRSYSYRLDDPRCFYPASTVKLPVAALALEKLSDLKLDGLTRDTPLRIEAGTPSQTAVDQDDSKADGLPTIVHYIKKIFLVSDNDAFNRRYELLGQREIDERLWQLGFTETRILRRLESGLDDAENRVTNPFVFFSGAREIYRQPLARNQAEQPFDFSRSNFLISPHPAGRAQGRRVPRGDAAREALPPEPGRPPLPAAGEVDSAARELARGAAALGAEMPSR